jgi:hypothetical protein
MLRYQFRSGEVGEVMSGLSQQQQDDAALTLLDILPDCACVIDSQNCILRVNAARDMIRRL